MKRTLRIANHIKEIELSGIRKCWEGATPDSINLGLGQPDFDTPAHIKAAAIKAIHDGLTGYTANVGMPELRSAISHKFWRDNGLDYKPEEIMVTSGASEALFLILAALVNKDDEVLIGDPSFLSYTALTTLVGGKPVRVPLNRDLRITPEAVEKRITDRTKAMIVNSPGNPTGAVQTQEELHALADLAEEKNIAMISDEVYEHLIYEGRHVSPAKYSDQVITVNAVSKTYSMTGWRLGYLGARGDILDHMLKIHQYVQACASSISQAAAIAALTGPQNCVSEMRDEFKVRRDLLAEGFEDMGIELTVPGGAFYAFPKVGDGDSTSAKLMKHGVMTVPGSAFGPGGREHIRISYAASRDKLKEAMRRMRDIL